MNAQRVDSSKINRVKNVIICQKCKLPLDVSETNEFDDSTQIYKKLGFKDTQQNEEILQSFFVIKHNAKHFCLICEKHFSLNKYNAERHFLTKHKHVVSKNQISQKNAYAM
ncbi:hypothetical protein A3Q56_03789 [Intoshia linei]|uniref:Uncharacterized protein n=1 Tax=Intoshia linei TaxID=1819745 RepID=A0A177B4B8_9BILA|nr:hypothetical protein A3Q56_03789 [Intoshia linei]